MDFQSVQDTWHVPADLHSRIWQLLREPTMQKTLNITPSTGIEIKPKMLSGSYHSIISISITDETIHKEYIIRIPLKLNELGDTHFPPHERLLKEVGLLMWVERNINLGDGVKTPKVLAYDSTFGDGNMLKIPWALLEKIKGVSLDSLWWGEGLEKWQRESILKQYVRILKRIEEVEFPRNVGGLMGRICPKNAPARWYINPNEQVKEIDLDCEGWDYWLGNGNREYGELEGPLREPMKPTNIGEKKSLFQKSIEGIWKWIPTFGKQEPSTDYVMKRKDHPVFREIKSRILGWMEASSRLPEEVHEECQTYLYPEMLKILDEMASASDFTGFDSFVQKSVLSHGDLYPRNILVDPSSYQITGIIDWDFAMAVPLSLTRELPSWLYNFEHVDGMNWEEAVTDNENEIKKYFFDETLWEKDVYMEFYGSAYWVGWLWEIAVQWPLSRRKGEKMAQFVKDCSRYLEEMSVSAEQYDEKEEDEKGDINERERDQMDGLQYLKTFVSFDLITKLKLRLSM